MGRGRALRGRKDGNPMTITDDDIYLVLSRYASTVPIPTVRVTALCREVHNGYIPHNDIFRQLTSLARTGRVRSLSWADNRDELTRHRDQPDVPLTPREHLARYWVINH